MKPATDKFGAMVAVLRGLPPPLPAALPGRRHRAPAIPDLDPFALAWDRERRPALINDHAAEGSTTD